MSKWNPFKSKLLNLVKNGFDGIEKQMDRRTKIKLRTAHKMIEFQRTVESLNKQIHQAANEIDLFSKVSQNKDYNIKKNRARINLDNSTMHLLSYMSLWDINVQQNIVNYKDVQRVLGNLLFEERLIIKPTYDYLLDNVNVPHHLDAVNCKKLFDKCITNK